MTGIAAVVAMMKEAAACTEAASGIAATVAVAVTATETGAVAMATSIAVAAVEQPFEPAVQSSEWTIQMAERLGGEIVVLGVMSVRNRGCEVLPSRRVIVSRHLAGKRGMKVPPVRQCEIRQAQSEEGRQCHAQRRASPFSETHGQSLTYLP
jgi:hypothetical protein